MLCVAAVKVLMVHVFTLHIFDPRFEKTGLQGFDLVPHKPGCTATDTEDG